MESSRVKEKRRDIEPSRKVIRRLQFEGEIPSKKEWHAEETAGAGCTKGV